MKYTLNILIEAPLEVCAKKFSITENMIHWHRGLVSVEHLSGTPSHLGAKMKLHYEIGEFKLEQVETITHVNFPNEIHCSYATQDMEHLQDNFFTATSQNQTQWVSVNECMPLNFNMRMKLWLAPKIFKKQSLLAMKDFKNFVEKGISVADA